MGNSIIMVFEGIANAFNFMINGIVAAINLIPGVNIPLIPKVVLPKFSFSTTSGGTTTTGPAGVTAGPDLLERSLLGAIPSGGPAVVAATPSATRGGGGGASSAAAVALQSFGPQGFIDSGNITPGFIGADFFGGLTQSDGGMFSAQPINITINAAVAEASLGDKIVDALTDYNRRSGPLDLQIAI